MVSRHRPDFSPEGWGRRAFTVLGTAFCIAVAYAINGYSKDWQWGPPPSNNFVIPLMVAPPFFLSAQQAAPAGARPSGADHPRLDRRADRMPEPARLTTRVEVYLRRSTRPISMPKARC